MPKPLDQIDRKILKSLLADARLTNNELGEKVGLSPSPCWPLEAGVGQVSG